MDSTVVKFKHIEDRTERGFIECTYPFSPVESIRMLKEVDTIVLDDDYYTYMFCEYIPSTGKGILDVVMVYVDRCDD